MTILDLPIRVDREAERISTHNGGASCDFIGNEAQRREAMRFYEQAPRMARLLLDVAGVACEDRTNGTEKDCFQRGAAFDVQCGTCRARTVLLDAGLMSDPDDRGEG